MGKDIIQVNYPVSGLEMKIKDAFLIFIVLSFSNLIVCMDLVDAGSISEVEPNDSFTHAQRVQQGSIHGIVFKNYTYGHLGDGNDTDFFMISVPSRKLLNIRIERVPENGFAVFVILHDHDLKRVDDFFLLGQPNGEAMEDEWFNSDASSRDVYIELVGEGEYDLTLKFENDFQLAFIHSLSFYSIPVLIFGIFIGIFIGIVLTELRWKNMDRTMKRWERIRKKGKARFIVLYGVIFWGLLMTTCNMVVRVLFNRDPFFWIFLQGLFYIVAFSLAGIPFGFIMWNSSEKMYNKWKEGNLFGKQWSPGTDRSESN